MSKITIVVVILTFLALFSPSASAQLGPNPFGNNANTINLGNNQPHGLKANDPNFTIGNLIANALQVLYIFAALAVLVFLIWGAFDWITSGGDKEKIAGARRKIVNALIGLALLALAAFIVSLFGQIVGFDPLNTPALPGLGDPPKPFAPAAAPAAR